MTVTRFQAKRALQALVEAGDDKAKLDAAIRAAWLCFIGVPIPREVDAVEFLKS